MSLNKLIMHYSRLTAKSLSRDAPYTPPPQTTPTDHAPGLDVGNLYY